ncbi:MAG: hypothetical protein K6L73_04085 [Cellvibrionaceae bacterium]
MQTDKKHWSQYTEAGTLLGIRFLFACYKIGGRALFQVLLSPVIAYFFLFRTENRHASIDYLKRIQGLKPHLTHRSLAILSIKHFWSFGNAINDKLAVWTGKITRENSTSHRDDIIKKLIREKRGCIMLISHLGNFEITRVLSSTHKTLQLTVLMHTKQAENFNKVLEELQDGLPIEVLQVSEITPATAMILSERLAKGNFIAISGDRTAIDNPNNNFNIPFLGEEANFSKGPFTLAAILKAPLISICCLKDKQHYNIYFDEISPCVDVSRKQRETTTRKLAEKYVKTLESYCLEKPLQWFNFYHFWAKQHSGEQQ